jgi:hypothetical protein
VSPTGTLVYVAGNAAGQADAGRTLVWVDRSGHEEATKAPPRAYEYPRLSPDGKLVAVSITDQEQDIWVWNLVDATLKRLTIDPAAESVLHLSDGPPRTEALLHAFAVHAEISADGHWLAYMSRDSGRTELYVRPFPNVNGGRWQVSNAGGSRPVWTRNSKELIYYEAGSGSIVTVPIQTGTTFSFGNPTKLFQWPTVGQPGLARTFDVTADGEKFLMIKEAGALNQAFSSNASSIVAVLNWVDEIEQRQTAK